MVKGAGGKIGGNGVVVVVVVVLTVFDWIDETRTSERQSEPKFTMALSGLEKAGWCSSAKVACELRRGLSWAKGAQKVDCVPIGDALKNEVAGERK